jgi:hypothetical protein
MKQLRKTQPAFATFFTNHVASSLHRYWAAKYPHDYQHFGYDASWVQTFCNEIDWVMGWADAMLSQLVAFVEKNRGYRLLIASSMGQAATEANVVLKQVYLKDVTRFMTALGFADNEWETRPAMLPRVILKVRDSMSEKLERGLATIQISDRGALPWKQLSRGVFRIHPGALQNVVNETCTIAGRTAPFEALGFSNEPIEDAAASNAYHIPSGILLEFDPQFSRAVQPTSQISTCKVAPMILRSLNATRPDCMKQNARSATIQAA